MNFKFNIGQLVDMIKAHPDWNPARVVDRYVGWRWSVEEHVDVPSTDPEKVPGGLVRANKYIVHVEALSEETKDCKLEFNEDELRRYV